MQTNLGRCHYGYDDDATLLGARVNAPGWIGVCARHRENAERDGFVLHELLIEAHPDDAAPPATDAPAVEEAWSEAVYRSVGLDILDEPYPEPAGGRPS